MSVKSPSQKLIPGSLTFCGAGFLFAASRCENMGVNGLSSDYLHSTFSDISFSSKRHENATFDWVKIETS